MQNSNVVRMLVQTIVSEKGYADTDAGRRLDCRPKVGIKAKKKPTRHQTRLTLCESDSVCVFSCSRTSGIEACIVQMWRGK